MINNISHILLRAEKPLVEALTLSWKVPSPELSSEKSLDLGKLLKNVALTVSDTFRGFQWFLEAILVANGIWWQTSQLVMFVAVVSKFQMCSFKPKMRLKPLFGGFLKLNIDPTLLALSAISYTACQAHERVSKSTALQRILSQNFIPIHTATAKEMKGATHPW